MKSAEWTERSLSQQTFAILLANLFTQLQHYIRAPYAQNLGVVVQLTATPGAQRPLPAVNCRVTGASAAGP